MLRSSSNVVQQDICPKTNSDDILGGNVPKKDQLFSKELHDCIEEFLNMNDHDFAEEFVEAEDIVNSYICAVDGGNTVFPSKEQLARAVLCLALSIPNSERPRAIWSLINSLISPENGVAFYSIKSRVNEIFLLAQRNLENAQKDDDISRSFKDFDDLF